MSALTAQLAELQQAHDVVDEKVAELTRNETKLKAAIDELRATEQIHLTAKIEAELRLKHEEERIGELTSLRAELAAGAARRTETIQSLEAEIEKLRSSEPDQQDALANLEARLRERQELNRKYEAARSTGCVDVRD